MPTDFSIRSILSPSKKQDKDGEEAVVVDKNDSSAETVSRSTPSSHGTLSNSSAETVSLSTPSSYGTLSNSDLRVLLHGHQLWRRFSQLGTEMIVTKSGRRMFPTVQISIAGLLPKESYTLMMDLESVDNQRYRYSFHQSRWTPTGPGEAELPCRVFVHEDSPSLGSHWMGRVVSFDRVKLTNNQLDDNGHMIVNSMHRYRPRVHILHHSTPSDLHHSSPPGTAVFSFPETIFIAVTAYQNHRSLEALTRGKCMESGWQSEGDCIKEKRQDLLWLWSHLPVYFS